MFAVAKLIYKSEPSENGKGSSMNFLSDNKNDSLKRVEELL